MKHSYVLDMPERNHFTLPKSPWKPHMLQISNVFKCPLIGQQLWKRKKKRHFVAYFTVSGLIALREQALQIGWLTLWQTDNDTQVEHSCNALNLYHLPGGIALMRLFTCVKIQRKRERGHKAWLLFIHLQTLHAYWLLNILLQVALTEP